MNEQPISALMLRYLAGHLSEAETRQLDGVLGQSRDAAQDFADLLAEHVMLADMGRAAAAEARARRSPTARAWLIAAAAAVLLAAAVWLATPAGYPAARLEGGARAAGPASPGRGSVVCTGPQAGALLLGGYCRVEMDPLTSLRIEGEPRGEQVFLERGRVTCDVIPSVGGFLVRTPVGSVWVTGTRFRVELRDEEGGEAMDAARVGRRVAMAVAVVLGGVAVSFEGRTVSLQAGRSRVFAAEAGQDARHEGGVLTGVVVQREGNAVTIRAEGEKEGKRYICRWVGGAPKDGGRPDPDMVARIGRLKPGDVVKVRWMRDEHLRILEILEQRAGAGEAREGGAASPDDRAPAAGKAEYRPRDGENWRERGRIVGRLVRASECEIAVIDAAGKAVESAQVRRGAQGYELQWLTPGKYALRVSGQGIKPLEVPGLEVKAGNDLIVDVEFPRAGGEERGERGERAGHEERGDKARRDPPEARAEGSAEALHGFRGMLIGKVVDKGKDGVTLEVQEIGRVWTPQNKAKNPQAAVGAKVRLAITERSHLRPQFQQAFESLKAGDRAEIEAFDLGGRALTIMESVRKL